MEVKPFNLKFQKTPYGDYVVSLWFEGETKPYSIKTVDTETAEQMLNALPDKPAPYGDL